MEKTYSPRKRTAVAPQENETAGTQAPSMDALRSGAAQASPTQRGRQVDLPSAMRSKMENAFGADLSAVKLYESQAVADAGAKAITQGISSSRDLMTRNRETCPETSSPSTSFSRLPAIRTNVKTITVMHRVARHCRKRYR